MTENSQALDLIKAERQRQIEQEGYAPGQDDRYTGRELLRAAQSYRFQRHSTSVPAMWPWAPRYWKPTPNDMPRQLVKSGALYLAEVERLKRKLAAPTDPPMSLGFANEIRAEISSVEMDVEQVAWSIDRLLQAQLAPTPPAISV